MRIAHQPRVRPRFASPRIVIAMLVFTLLAGGVATVLGPRAAASYSSVTATTAVNIRSGPGTGYRILGVLYAGQKLDQAGSVQGGWMPVTFRGQKAYVSAQYLSNSTTNQPTNPPAMGRGGYTVTTTTSVNLRSGPGLTNQVITVMAKGTTLKVTGAAQNGYAPVVYQDRQGWASASYLSRGITGGDPLPTTGLSQARATVALMARTTSDNSFVSVGDIPAGTIMTMTGVKENGVAQVIWKGSLRWVNARYVVPVDNTNGVNPPPLPPVTGTRYATVALNIRTTSGSDSVTITEAPSGTALSITGVVENARAQIIWQGAVRWVTARYLSTTKPGSNQGGVGLDALRPNAKNLVKVIFSRYPQVRTIYGVRPDSLPDHPSGHAIDVMLPRGTADNALGWQMAQWLRANAAELHIQYVIFDQKIWNVSRDSEGWRTMSDRGSATANHKDHVHITTVWD